MSYHNYRPTPFGAVPQSGLLPPVQPHQYPIVPLSQGEITTRQMSDQTKKMLIALALLFGLLLIVWLVMSAKRPQPMTRNRAAKKLTTAELAKTLYERLERRGKTNPTVLRSLQSYAAKK